MIEYDFRASDGSPYDICTFRIEERGFWDENAFKVVHAIPGRVVMRNRVRIAAGQQRKNIEFQTTG